MISQCDWEDDCLSWAMTPELTWVHKNLTSKTARGASFVILHNENTMVKFWEEWDELVCLVWAARSLCCGVHVLWEYV